MGRVSFKAPLPEPIFDYLRAFSRNLGLVSEAEQLALRTKRIAIPGCGGVGSVHALVNARMGIGNFNLADFDRYEIENMNRQYGAKISTLGREKVEVVKSEILDINPTADVATFGSGVTRENIDEFLNGVDLVIDSLDYFAFQARDLLFPEARRRGIPLITAAPLGFSCALLVFTARSMRYEDYFAFSPRDSKAGRALKFALGLAPKATQRVYMDRRKIDLESGRGPSHIVGVTLCAALAAGEAVKILLARGEIRAVPYYYQFDAHRGLFRRGYLWWGNRNPWQRLKIWLAAKFFIPRKEVPSDVDSSRK